MKLHSFAIFASAVTYMLAAQVRSSPNHQEVAAISTELNKLHTSVHFPVPSKNFDDICSTFGIRLQSSGDRYDFHRGIDISGSQGDSIVAALDGTFWKYTKFNGGGNAIILRHKFPKPVQVNGRTFSYFYTLYLHLWDDGTAGNQTSTDDIIDQWIPEVTHISAGQQIGCMGNSGTPPNGGSYSDHLHFELRVGTRLSLEYQINNDKENGGTVTNYGFDPHLHPLLLFPKVDQTLNLVSTTSAAKELDIAFTCSSDDDSPSLSAYKVELLDQDGQVLTSHVLNYNTRQGFDASSTTILDTKNIDTPYLDPVPFKGSDTRYNIELIVPKCWNLQYPSSSYLRVTLEDIWGNSTQHLAQLTSEACQLVATPQKSQQRALCWNSSPGDSYVIERSFDLISWQPISDSIVASPRQNSLEFTDDSEAPTPVFYRVKHTPMNQP